MEITLLELARRIGGQAVGQTDLVVDRLAPMDESEPNALTLPNALTPYFYKNALPRDGPPPRAVLTNAALHSVALDRGVSAAVIHESPDLALCKLIDLFYPQEPTKPGIDPSAVVSPNADIHPSVLVLPGAVVASDVVIGEGSVIGPRAVVCAGSRIGRHVTIGPGAIVGSEGFGFAKTKDGPVRIRHVGRVVIEDHVEIGANTCIDRATLGSTVIGEFTKVDNLVQVGHNARIGKGVFIAAQVGLAGSTTVKDGAMLGGQVGIADHLTVGKSAKVAAKSGVTKDVQAGSVVGGYPAMQREKWLRATAWLLRAAARKNDPNWED